MIKKWLLINELKWLEMPMQSTLKLKYNNVKDGLSEADMYMLPECELIDTGPYGRNIPSQETNTNK